MLRKASRVLRPVINPTKRPCKFYKKFIFDISSQKKGSSSVSKYCISQGCTVTQIEYYTNKQHSNFFWGHYSIAVKQPKKKYNNRNIYDLFKK